MLFNAHYEYRMQRSAPAISAHSGDHVARLSQPPRPLSVRPAYLPPPLYIY